MITKRFFIAAIMLAISFISCERSKHSTENSGTSEIPQFQFEATGEDYLISALDELEAIADWTNINQSPGRKLALPQKNQKAILAKTSIDTIYIYGALTADGYGATITERYTHPKGILLITVRRSYGKENGHTVTETKRYISHSDYLSDNPQQSNITEIFGLSRDTIVTHVTKNGTLETYTFRLPVVTRTINPQDGSVKVSSRFGLNNMVVNEVRDGNNVVQQVRKTYGQSDGGLITRSEYADSTWRQVRTLGHSDGSILREITSSL